MINANMRLKYKSIPDFAVLAVVSLIAVLRVTIFYFSLSFDKYIIK